MWIARAGDDLFMLFMAETVATGSGSDRQRSRDRLRRPA